MDPLSQGVVGLTAAQLVSKPAQKVAAAVIGFLSGMAADLDVLIRSTNDPLFSLEFHRHFTHALVFIPFGALLCAVVFYWLINFWSKHKSNSIKQIHLEPTTQTNVIGGGETLSFKAVYIFCFSGYATHALLDACTTYGTQLLWPFSNARIAWNNVSVIDPLFTVPLLILIAFAVTKRSTPLAWVGAIYAVGYLSLGVVQNQRAKVVALELAQSRGHDPISLGLKPSFANIIVWKSVYEYEGRYYVDAVRIGFTSKIYQGSSTPKMVVEQHFPWVDKNSQQAKDIERFRWFSNNHLGIDPDNVNRIIDIRYSLTPNRLDGMWGITLDPNAELSDHVDWTNSRPQGEALKKQASSLWTMILGR